MTEILLLDLIDLLRREPGVLEDEPRSFLCQGRLLRIALSKDVAFFVLKDIAILVLLIFALLLELVYGPPGHHLASCGSLPSTEDRSHRLELILELPLGHLRRVDGLPLTCNAFTFALAFADVKWSSHTTNGPRHDILFLVKCFPLLLASVI